MMNGACQFPYWKNTPKMKGDRAPPILPAMFIMPETVPEYLPPQSIGTDQDGADGAFEKEPGPGQAIDRRVGIIRHRRRTR